MALTARLVLGSVLLTLVTAALVGAVAYSTARKVIQQQATIAVGITAEAREQALVERLRRQQERAVASLEMIATRCAAADRSVCEAALKSFVQTEGARGARFNPPSGAPILVGTAEHEALDAPAAPGQLARVLPGRTEPREYVITASAPAAGTLKVVFSSAQFAPIFLERYGLGESGESFLVDPQGFFITPPRFRSESGHSHPIEAQPMRLCLRGARGEMLAPDYAGRMVIHGFRSVEVLGGACIMAHMAAEEAFAPARGLAERLAIIALLLGGVVSGASVLFARRVTRPIRTLTDAAARIERGERAVAIPLEGPSDLQTFAETFKRMAESIGSSEAALVESEARLRRVLETALDAVVATDENSVVVEWNSRAESMFGWSRQEAFGRQLSELIIPSESREAHRRGVERFLSTGEGPILNRRVELISVRRSGERFPAELTVSAIRRGERWMFYGFIADISARKQADADRQFLANASAALVASLDYEETFRTATRAAVGYFADWCFADVRTENGTFRRVAVAHGRADDADLATTVGQYSVRLDDPRYPPARAYLSQTPVLVSDTSEGGLGDLRRDDGHAAAVRAVAPRSLISVPLLARGVSQGALTFVLSHSARTYGEADLRVAAELGRWTALAADNARLYRDAQEAVRIRDEFLSVASHELKTPLTPLLLRLQVLEREAKAAPEGPFTEVARSYISAARSQVNRLSGLVQDLLDVSRIQAGRLTFDLEQVDLSTLAADVARQYTPYAHERGSRLTLDVEPGIRGEWDRFRLEQVLVNLIDNALKYGAGGEIRVAVRCDAGGAILEVADRGIGIPPDQHARIFERYGRAVSDRNYGGLGLGLYITQTIVEGLGGDISVASAAGKGAVFTVRLPLHAQRTDEPHTHG